MKITKTRTKVTEYEVVQVSNAPMKYTKYFKEIRKKSKEKFDKCFMCENKFELGDDLYILFMKNSTNKVVCNKCAKEINLQMENNHENI